MAVPLLVAGGLALGGVALKAYGAHQATKGLDKNLSEVETRLAEWKDSVGHMDTLRTDLQNQATAYMDRGSQINQEARRDIEQTSQDFVAQQNRLAQRNMYGGGIGGASGIGIQQGLESTHQGHLQSQEAFRQQLAQNRQTGLNLQTQSGSLLGSVINQKRDYGETMAQGYLQNDMLKRQAQQAMWSGLGEGLINIGTAGMGAV